MNDPNEKLAEVEGAGGERARVSAEWLAELKAKLEEVSRRAEEWATRRAECSRTRFNRWSGQSQDGRRWDENTGIETEPFDGASDQRVWMVDETIREQEALRVVALARASLRCEARNGARDDRQARALTVLLRWLRDRMGTSWYAEHKRLTNYELGDSPAVALMRIWWRREQKLDMRTLGVEELAALWQQEYRESIAQQGMEAPEEEYLARSMSDFAETLLNPEAGEDDLAAMIVRFFPRLTLARARRAVRDLRKTGKAEIPVPVVAYEGPAISARRFLDDFVVPDNTREFDRVPMWFEPEWLTKTELLERKATDGWGKGFVEDVLEHDGEAAIRDYEETQTGQLVERTPDDHRGTYQVVWAWFLASNEDGFPARYYTVMHPSSERTAFGRRMYRAPGDRWPGVFHRREQIDKWALNSRSVAEIDGPAQFGVKLLRDVGVDNANIGGLPPFVTFGHSNKGVIDLAPLSHLPLRQGGDAKFMQPPAFPASARAMAEDMQSDRDRYWGRAVEGVDPQLATMRREADVAEFMDRVRDELQIILDLALVNMDPAEITRILDQEGARLNQDPADLAGQYDVRIVFDPADLDMESVIRRCSALKDVLLAVDVDKTIDASRYVEYGVRALFPQIAGDGIRTAQEGTRKEIEDEQENYAKLRAGVMPEMNTEGAWNYAARRAWWDELAQGNPAVFDDLAPDKRALIEQWIAALDQQVQQYGENVRTGRTGAAGVEEE